MLLHLLLHLLIRVRLLELLFLRQLHLMELILILRVNWHFVLLTEWRIDLHWSALISSNVSSIWLISQHLPKHLFHLFILRERKTSFKSVWTAKIFANFFCGFRSHRDSGVFTTIKRTSSSSSSSSSADILNTN